MCVCVEGGGGEGGGRGGVYVWRVKWSISSSLTVSVPVLSGLRYQPVSVVWWDGGIPLQTTPFSILLPYRKETHTRVRGSVLIKGYLGFQVSSKTQCYNVQYISTLIKYHNFENISHYNIFMLIFRVENFSYK